jgi:hypothetical protein
MFVLAGGVGELGCDLKVSGCVVDEIECLTVHYSWVCVVMYRIRLFGFDSTFGIRPKRDNEEKKYTSLKRGRVIR